MPNLARPRTRRRFLTATVYEIATKRARIAAGLDRALWAELVAVERAEDARAYDSADSPNRQRLQLLGLVTLSKNSFVGEHYWALTDAGRQARRTGRLSHGEVSP